MGLEADTAGHPVAGSLTIRVVGTPIAQGSKRAFVNKYTGRAQVVDDAKGLMPWREAVTHAALLAREDAEFGELIPTEIGPVRVVIRFLFNRPKGHYGTGRNANLVKESAPAHPVTARDVDKLSRGVLDALTAAGVFADDKQVIELTAVKAYTAGVALEGAEIRVEGIG